jgi:hypothetical protein
VDFVPLIQLRDYGSKVIFHCHLHSEDCQRGCSWAHDTVPKLERVILALRTVTTQSTK